MRGLEPESDSYYIRRRPHGRCPRPMSSPPPPAPRTSKRGYGFVLSGLLLGLGIGFLSVPRAASDDDDSPLPAVSFLGQQLSPDITDADLRSRLRQRINTPFGLVLDSGKQRLLSYAELGVTLDAPRLSDLLRHSRDRTSPMLRSHRRRGGDGGITLPIPLNIDPIVAERILLRYKDELDRPTVDARIDVINKKLVPSQVGLLLDVDSSLSAIGKALSAGETHAKLVFEKLVPGRRTEQLKNVVHSHVIGSFETGYDRAKRSAARTHNLRLAASRLDGYVVFPGEIFDFNGVVGPRDEAHGYEVATVIAQGELVDGIGGGSCQISGTLHGAAFFAGLGIAERHPHTRPSSYIKMGLDAAVVYPTINFKLRNDFKFPIVIHQSVQDGKVKAEILGPQHDQAVTLIRRIASALPYQELERADPRLARGKRSLQQRGVPGFRLKRYRVLRHGPHAVREKWNDVYPPTAQIVRIGTGDPDSSRDFVDDPHPEYVADELLVMTQLKPGEKLRITRETGRFGEKGWTAREGMPSWTRH